MTVKELREILTSAPPWADGIPVRLLLGGTAASARIVVVPPESDWRRAAVTLDIIGLAAPIPAGSTVMIPPPIPAAVRNPRFGA